MLEVATIPELEILHCISIDREECFLIAFRVVEIDSKYNRYVLN